MAITATFLEDHGQKPDEVAALLGDFLLAARSSLHLAIYDFRLGETLAKPVVEALRQRAAAGVDVRIAYDAGKPAFAFQQASADPAPPGTARQSYRWMPSPWCRNSSIGPTNRPSLQQTTPVPIEVASNWA